MIIKIEIKDGLDPERVLDYFYYKCLDEPSISKDKFKVKIEGTELSKGR